MRKETRRIILFIPVFNCENQIGRVLEKVVKSETSKYISEIIIIDNGSKDDTLEKCREFKAKKNSSINVNIIKNRLNYGLGGSHKVAFEYAIENKYDWIIVLHGDDQGLLNDFDDLIVSEKYINYDVILGSRFHRESTLIGYSKFRIFGNLIFNSIYSLALRHRVRDLGSGLNLYNVKKIEEIEFFKHPDNLSFNCVLLANQIILGQKIEFFPISWREDDQISNVKLFSQSWITLKIALCTLFKRKTFHSIEFREKIINNYQWDLTDE